MVCNITTKDDFISGFPPAVDVFASGLVTGLDYVLEITDQFGNVYHVESTATADGALPFAEGDLPDGFLNPGMGAFLVRIKADAEDCPYETFTIDTVTYDGYMVKVLGGPFIKSYVGCP